MKLISHIKKFPENILFFILFLSFGLRIFNLNYNSPFLDEAQYLVLGKKVLEGHWQELDPFSWVGGMPLIYPPIAALFGFFGILGARFLNVIFGTLAVYLIYEFSKNLQLSENKRTNEIIGLVAAFLLGILAIPLYLSRLAIYDMPSFTFFLVGLVLLQKALLLKQPDLWQRENRFFFSSIFFLLSFLTKYTTFIFLPFILLWALYASRKQGKEALRHYIKYFAAIIIGGTIAYFTWHFDALSHFFVEQIGERENQSQQIISQFVEYSLPAFITAVLALVIFLLRQKFNLLPFMLLLGALVVPLVHLTTNNVKAINQQTFLSLIFLLPLTAYFFTFLLEKTKTVGGVIVTIAFLGLFINSQNQLKSLQASWSNTQNIMNYMKLNTTSHERLLSFEDDVTKLSLTNLKDDNIVGIYSFSYENTTDDIAYAKALEDGYFDLILFNSKREVEKGNKIKSFLTSHYKAIHTDDHHLVVYKLREEK